MHESDDDVARPIDDDLGHDELLDVVLHLTHLQGRCDTSTRTIAIGARGRPTTVERPSHMNDDLLVTAFQHLKADEAVSLTSMFDRDDAIRAFLREVALAWLPIGAPHATAAHTWIALVDRR